MVARLTLVGVLVLVGSMFAGGCVSADKYHEAVAQNDRISAELAKALADLEAMRAERDKLREQLAQAENAGDSERIKSLLAENEALKKALDELQAKIAGMPEVEPGAPQVALPAEADQALIEFAAQHPELVEYDREHGMVKFKTDLLFEKGSDEIAPKAKEALQQFASIINKTPSIAKFRIYIAGHTDDIAIKRPETLRRHPTNWYLSAHRSVAVEEVLQSAGLAAPRLGVAAFSEFHPAAANAPGGRGNALNRRVEVWIVPPAKFLTADAPAASSDEQPAKAPKAAAPKKPAK